MSGGLPTELDALVGREGTLDTALSVLGDARLVTLLGAGGVGKTRLAIRVAETVRARSSMPGDVVVVRLAARVEPGDGARVGPAVLRACGLTDSSDDPPQTRLLEYLGDRETLLVLDNCEHVVDAVGELVAILLSAAPGLRVLATSREPLGVRGEHRLVVPPLSHEEGVRLLTLRARERGVDIDPGDLDAARLVGDLGGLPLAIEMAAGRLDVRSLGDVRRGVRRGLAALTAAASTDQAHHRSMMAVMAWSDHLLTDQERLMWALLAEFRGEFSERTVLALGTRVGLDDDDVLVLLDELVRKSIVARGERNGHTRFSLLQTVRAYGMGIDPVECPRTRIRRAFADHVAHVVAGAAAEWYGPRELPLLHEVSEIVPDIAGALSYLAADPDRRGRALVLALGVCSTRALVFSGQINEGRRLIAAAMEHHDPEHPTLTEVSALSLGAWLAYVQGQPDAGDTLLEQASVILEQLGDPPPPAAHVFATGTRLYVAAVGDPEMAARSVRMLDGAATIAIAEAESGPASMCALFAALAAAFHGVSTGPVSPVERARLLLADTQRAEAAWSMTWALWAVALAEHEHGDIDAAVAALRRSITEQHRMGDYWGLAWGVWLAAVIAASRGQHADAAMLFGGAATLQRLTNVVVAGLGPFQVVERSALTSCETALGAEAVAATIHVGTTLNKDDAVALVLSTLDRGETATPATRNGPADVTERELEVVALVAEGLTNAEIATRLHKSMSTVADQIASARRKLVADGVDARTRAALGAWYLHQFTYRGR